MTDQPTLFGDAPLPAHNGRPTSVAAAESARDGAAAQRETVYRALYATARWGATREELATATGIGGDSIRPRVDELVKSGRVVETDRKRLTAKRRNAAVLMCAAWVRPERAED